MSKDFPTWQAARAACKMGAKVEFMRDPDTGWTLIRGPNWWADGTPEELEQLNASFQYRLADETKT